MSAARPLPEGFRYCPGRLDRAGQEALAAQAFGLAEAAPFYRPVMPRTATPLRVRMTNFGPLGWISDVSGYRYEPRHPLTGAPWPPIPEALLALWDALAVYPAPPQACLVNLYERGSRLGLHVDADEDARDAPVLSVSLGAEAVFRIGGPRRGDPSQSLRLRSGDLVVLGGAARRCFHGVDRIVPGTSTLIPDGARLNLTLRRVTAPALAHPGASARIGSAGQA